MICWLPGLLSSISLLFCKLIPIDILTMSYTISSTATGPLKHVSSI